MLSIQGRHGNWGNEGLRIGQREKWNCDRTLGQSRGSSLSLGVSLESSRSRKWTYCKYPVKDRYQMWADSWGGHIILIKMSPLSRGREIFEERICQQPTFLKLWKWIFWSKEEGIWKVLHSIPERRYCIYREIPTEWENIGIRE